MGGVLRLAKRCPVDPAVERIISANNFNNSSSAASRRHRKGGKEVSTAVKVATRGRPKDRLHNASLCRRPFASGYGITR